MWVTGSTGPIGVTGANQPGRTWRLSGTAVTLEEERADIATSRTRCGATSAVAPPVESALVLRILPVVQVELARALAEAPIETTRTATCVGFRFSFGMSFVDQ